MGTTRSLEQQRSALFLLRKSQIQEAAHVAVADHEEGASWEDKTGMHTLPKKEKGPALSAAGSGAGDE